MIPTENTEVLETMEPTLISEGVSSEESLKRFVSVFNRGMAE